jgi:hypothetical protein
LKEGLAQPGNSVGGRRGTGAALRLFLLLLLLVVEGRLPVRVMESILRRPGLGCEGRRILPACLHVQHVPRTLVFPVPAMLTVTQDSSSGSARRQGTWSGLKRGTRAGTVPPFLPRPRATLPAGPVGNAASLYESGRRREGFLALTRPTECSRYAVEKRGNGGRGRGG